MQTNKPQAPINQNGNPAAPTPFQFTQAATGRPQGFAEIFGSSGSAMEMPNIPSLPALPTR